MAMNEFTLLLPLPEDSSEGSLEQLAQIIDTLTQQEFTPSILQNFMARHGNVQSILFFVVSDMENIGEAAGGESSGESPQEAERLAKERE